MCQHQPSHPVHCPATPACPLRLLCLLLCPLCLPLLQYVGRSFSASPRQLGFITLACALVQAICAPVGGLMGHYMNR